MEVSEELERSLVDLKVVLERLASGHSLEPLLRIVTATIADVVNAPFETSSDLQGFFSKANHWLDRALDDPAYTVSRSGTRTAEQLYDSAHALLTAEAEDAPWAQHIRLLFDQCNRFISALESDPSTQRLIRSIDELMEDVQILTRKTLTSAGKWRDELIRDLLGWLVPRVLKSMHSLPMPRVEFQNPTLDVALFC